MLVGVKPTQLTYCVTFIDYQYASGWCSRRRHCVTDRAGLANQPTFHWHHTYQPAISDHLTPTGWMNHRPAERRFSHYAPCMWNSLPRTVRSADSYDCFKARLEIRLFDTVWRCVTLRMDLCPWFWNFVFRNEHVKILWLIYWLIDGVMIGSTNCKKWLTFGGDPVPDTDSASLLHIHHHCAMGYFRRFMSISHTFTSRLPPHSTKWLMPTR